MEEVRNGTVAIVLSEDVRTESGRALERAIKARVPDANVIYVDPRIATAMSERSIEGRGPGADCDRRRLCSANCG